jgi:hypothetical protein
MSKEYLIVLFKNKKKKKIIKSYNKKNLAENFFKDLLKSNSEIVFDKRIENATQVDYQIGLLSKNDKTLRNIFFTDDLGRNIMAELENEDYVFLNISNYKMEEKLFDWQQQKKISFGEFISTYCIGDLKSIYTLNNKICVQKDQDISIFSLKDIDESYRFLDILQNYYYTNSRYDAIFTKDISTAQRKWIYNILEEKGFDKKRLYRLKTTFSKR